ncbi:DNA mismatch repair endonuclease MutL [Lacicoccus alkaliphilus]|uniref:DNA mismatch repair protein MutL n=1 Tax=Lacicoccus alkaliphilus DSM 16010 TaxID=1123231 RepID=A0A1M7C0N3_9BACL|nr:DNA mismatch repair endonuclease MutL [Salinicoccus alkaliphilus]SHL60771.1 DNA mismatch repair protein MutL [Salinicoccus alkaliphilus DSM 16010]
MSKIKILDPKIQNKIAAGEVVERPSSVVKELIENSIDAGSGEIQVSIEESGMKEIRVIDDGEGIEAEDAPLLFERHATSKIGDDYDLFQIRTMGFRGEALASIGAVAKVTLETMHKESEPVKLQYEGGAIVADEPGKARNGTDITIREIFFNTPARLKYVRSLRTEAGKVIDIVQRMALNHPAISFTLLIDGREKLRTGGKGDLKAVIADIYGINVARLAVPVEAESPDFHITGYIVKPEVTRSHRNFINLSVNQRFIRNFKLTQSIINGYHTLQPKDKYPIAVLNMEMDPKIVDVNVHPAKTEVRFSKEMELNALVENTVRNALREETLIPDVEKNTEKREKEKAEQPKFEFSRRAGTAAPGTSPKQDFNTGSVKEAAERPASRAREPVFRTEERAPYSHRGRVKREKPGGSETGTATGTAPSLQKQKLPYLEIIGQLHGTYILMQNDSGMYMMDQHAAQERIKYEYYYENIQKDGDGVPLLIPYTFEFPLDDVITIDEKIHDLKDLGFEIEKTGAKNYSVSRYPDWIRTEDPEEDIASVIDFICHKDHFSVNDYREEMSIMMSCKKSIKANHHLDKRQMEALLEALNKCESPYTCPHGRPVIIQMTTYEIERMFNRIMK